MAVEVDKDVTVPQSTGAVQSPTDPVTTTAAVGHPVSTDAVMPVSGPVTTEFGPSGQDPTGAVPNPGPVTTRNPAIKVIRSPRRAAAEAQTAAETASRAPEQDDRPRRQAPPDDYDGR